MNCPYCNSDEIYKVLFGKITDKVRDMIEDVFCYSCKSNWYFASPR